jgi:tRNA(His) 5'-end guanylyltransferase
VLLALYNTAFWALIQQGGLTAQEAHKELSGTVSSEKNEILFTRFNINYSHLDAIYRRGSLILWEAIPTEQAEKGDTEEQKKVGALCRRDNQFESKVNLNHLLVVSPASPPNQHHALL